MIETFFKCNERFRRPVHKKQVVALYVPDIRQKYHKREQFTVNFEMASATGQLAGAHNGYPSHDNSISEQDNELAIVSVSDKIDVVEFARRLAEFGKLQLVATGGTAAMLTSAGLDVVEVSTLTGEREMLGGRVKSLHPKVHAGILARNTTQDLQDLAAQHIRRVRVVVCNLYPFEQVVAPKMQADWDHKIENIDIGGVTLLRAAAKNHDRVTVVCDPADYESVLSEIASSENHDTTLETRRRLAAKAFALTAAYDTCVANQLMLEFYPEGLSTKLRYGLNPQQQPAFVTAIGGQKVPFSVLNGSPSYINVLDALNAWQLVRELRAAFDPPMPAAASFKHVSPAGAAFGVPLSPTEARAYFVDDINNLSTLACAYARARGADRLSSFGDFIALSDKCDAVTAHIISREVSDGVIAPSYTPEAFELLASKKSGSYLVLRMDPNYEPMPDRLESRDVFGLQLKQAPSTVSINFKVFQEGTIVGGGAKLDQDTLRDMIVATAAAKYTQSNSVIFACNGQVVGVGAGQQSRIHCVRLAGDKVRNWWLRQHPKTLALQFKPGVKRAEKSNLIDAFVRREIGLELPRKQCYDSMLGDFDADFKGLSESDADSWMQKLSGVVLSSDAFFPFRDCVDYAAKTLNVKYIASPGGSSNDKSSIEAAEEHGVTLVHTGLRLFHH